MELMIGCILIGCTKVSNAQIKVFDGNVGIGLTGSANAQSKLEVNGGMNIYNGAIILRPDGTTLSLSIKSVSTYIPNPAGGLPFAASIPAIISSMNYAGQLRNAGFKFGSVYLSGLYYESVYQNSDRTLKKNIQPAAKAKRRLLKKVKVYTYDMNEKNYESVENAA